MISQPFSESSIPPAFALDSLLQYVQQRMDTTKRNLISSISRDLVTAYHMGGGRAVKQLGPGHRGPMDLQGLNPIVDKLSVHLDETFGSMGAELTDIIKQGLRDGWTYEKVQQALAEKIQSGWGKEITFDSVGQVRRTVQVAPNGALSWTETTISRPVTLPADAYAETLARTTMKQAYAAGHFDQYENAGRTGWRYLSVADERTRPHHLALHGRVFIIGTPEEEMARQVMSEYNCRCRPVPWFDDPAADTADSVFTEQRQQWAQQAIDEDPEGPNTDYLQQVIRNSGSSAGATA